MHCLDVYAEQCHQDTPDPLTILATVCEKAQTLPTTDRRTDINGSAEYDSQSLHSMASFSFQNDKLNEKELTVENITMDGQKPKFITYQFNSI